MDTLEPVDTAEHPILPLASSVIPEPSEWELFFKHFGHLKGTNYIYCHYFSNNPACIIFVLIITCLCYGIHLVITVPGMRYLSVQIVAGVETSFAVILFALSYLCASCRDPGYLPFNWNLTQRTKYTWQELMAGTAIRAEQITYAQSVPRPPSCSYSKEYGRYIIRGDHICGWIGNWVAKRNHKHFILMLIWGVVAAISLFVWGFMPKRPDRNQSSEVAALEFAAKFIEALFGILLVFTSSSFIAGVLSNQTQIQRHKRLPQRQVPKMEACRAICGNGPIYCWPFPVDAFQDEIILEESGHVPGSEVAPP
jgi:energy-coupling factor transporter transmembrane protein EcfT